MQRISTSIHTRKGFNNEKKEKSETIKIQNRKKGIARDIIREARNGYEAVVTRRRGMTGLRGIILGSVAIKLKEMAGALKAAQIKLIDMGLKTDKVSTQIQENAISRAGTIVEKAKQEGFATIIMGRRGHSHVRDFFIGRVTNKVIHMARDRTVWVII